MCCIMQHKYIGWVVHTCILTSHWRGPWRGGGAKRVWCAFDYSSFPLLIVYFITGYEPRHASTPTVLGRRCCTSVKQGSRDGRLSAGDDRRKWGSWCSGGARTRGTKYGLVTRHDKKTPRSSFRRSARGLTTIRPPMSPVGRCEDDARTMRGRYSVVLAGRSRRR